MTASKPACYGAMVPDLSKLRVNAPCEGRAFGVRVESAGIGVQSREVRVKKDGRDKCVECPHYRSCYDLPMAKLALGHALRAYA